MTTIRAMTRDDIVSVAEWMSADPHWQTYGMTVSSIEHEFTGALERGDLLIVAETDQYVAGFAWVVPNGMFGSHHYLKRIGVDPLRTGQSIGAALMNHLERHLAATGARYLFLLVGSQNPRAEAFYQRRGFVQMAVFPDFAVPGIEERLYRKALNALSY